MKQITARFNSTCNETGRKIKKGDQMIYDYNSKKCYCIGSETAKKHIEDEDEDQEARSTAAYVNDVLEYNYYR